MPRSVRLSLLGGLLGGRDTTGTLSVLQDSEKCFSCDSRSPSLRTSHRIQNVVYLGGQDGHTTWWQSENGEGPRKAMERGSPWGRVEPRLVGRGRGGVMAPPLDCRSHRGPSGQPGLQARARGLFLGKPQRQDLHPQPPHLPLLGPQLGM